MTLGPKARPVRTGSTASRDHKVPKVPPALLVYWARRVRPGQMELTEPPVHKVYKGLPVLMERMVPRGRKACKEHPVPLVLRGQLVHKANREWTALTERMAHPVSKAHKVLPVR